MRNAQFHVAFAGPQVTVQDSGRRGAMRYGVPASGAMDRKALRIANLALGNPAMTPMIEVSRGGLRLDCTAGMITLAIAGGGFIVERDEVKSGAWQILHIRAGQNLTIRPGPWGSWTYLAFAGNLQVAAWLGSCSTHALSNLGGGKLLTGQNILVTDARMMPERAIPCPVWARPRPQPRVVIGPQDRFFAPDTIADFTSHTYRLTDAYDRMGVRLSGPAIAPHNALGIASEAILRGSVQVSGDGVATVLLADHQTTGGYPKIATLIDDDTDGFAQLRPGDGVRFTAISPKAALSLARAAHHRQAAHDTALARIAATAG